jgi:hypothetical protein
MAMGQENAMNNTGPEHTERWRGAVDEKLRALADQTHETGKDMTKLFDKVDNLQQQVAKLIVYVGLGAFFGSAIISVIVGIVIKVMAK